jgi:hypothetical protein
MGPLGEALRTLFATEKRKFRRTGTVESAASTHSLNFELKNITTGMAYERTVRPEYTQTECRVVKWGGGGYVFPLTTI